MSDTTASGDLAATPPALLALPEELTIYSVGALHSDWLAWLAVQRDEVVIDGGAVAQVDAAGVQLLASLLRSIEARELGWRVRGVGAALRDALHTLGLEARFANGPVAAQSC
jgi:anti-anti-sigma regulatory factor